MYGGYYPARPEPDEVIDLVGLSEKRDTRVKKLSGGQQRRLDVAIALAGDPELLFLDEPTTGFDPSARRNAWEIIKSLAGLGKTVFLTTHFMDEAQYLADRVAVISRGEIVAEGHAVHHRRDGIGCRPGSCSGCPRGRDRPGLGEVPLDDGTWEITADDPTELLHRLTGWAMEHAVALHGLTVSRPSLEDVYLEITDGEEGEG